MNVAMPNILTSGRHVADLSSQLRYPALGSKHGKQFLPPIDSTRDPPSEGDRNGGQQQVNEEILKMCHSAALCQ